MIFRHPTAEDGAAIWRLVRDSGVLDLNSSYCYLMMGQYFANSCMVAVDDTAEPGQTQPLAGFVIGFRPPQDAKTLFIWQVAVDASQRGKGIGSRLLQELLHSPVNSDVRMIEATISPSNTASQALFKAAAAKLDAEFTKTPLFPAEWFPGDSDEHEAEDRYRVGPFTLKTHENQ